MANVTSTDLYSLQGKPVCTVAVPVAHLTEPPEQVIRAAEEIARSATLAGPVQITLWCNATVGSGRLIAYEQFRQLLKVAKLSRRLSTVGLRLVLDILPSRFPATALGQIKKIKQVRTNYMRSIIEDWHLGKIDEDHPVLWFDADTTFVDSITIPAILQALKDNRAYFIKGRMVYTGQPEDDRTIPSRSPAERVAIIYGAVHSALESTLGSYDEREYVDECGIAFKLSTYIRAGGLARARGPMQGESRVLLNRARKKLKAGTPLVTYVSSARHGTLYRRYQTLAQYLRPDEIFGQTGDLYFLNSDMTQSDFVTVPIKQSDVLRMVEAMLQHHIALHPKNPLSLMQTKIINDLVTLAFPKENVTSIILHAGHALSKFPAGAAVP